MTRMGCALTALAVLTLGGTAHADWLESWGASPLPPSDANGFFGASPSFDNQTVRQVVRLSAGGDQVRVEFTNEYGDGLLTIGAASVALAEEDGTPAGPVLPLTFSGERSAQIPAGAPLLSDPVALPVEALQSLAISAYFPEATGPCTCHLTGVQSADVSGAGDFTGEADFAAAETIGQRIFLSGVQVWAGGEGKTIVMLGDSITDGVGATPETNSRWPDFLAARLAGLDDGTAYAISNQGISGNRLLAGGMGEAILARLDRDVFAAPGADTMVLFIGVNDLGMGLGSQDVIPGLSLPAGPDVSAESMIAGYRQVIARAHAEGLEIIGATIAPYKGATYWSEEGEAVRQAINAWIRESGEFDGVIDFDAALAADADPAQMEEGLHMGDYLHGSPEGYAAMADSIDLSLFQ